MSNYGYTKRAVCPICGKQLVAPGGRSTSKILLVGDYPGKDEVIKGIPLIGRVGDVLHAELLKVGLIFADLRHTNLWQHAKDEATCDPAWHLDQLAKEFKGKTHVLMMGSHVTQALIGHNVEDRSGLKVKVSGYKGINFWVSPSPALAHASPIGEMRLAMQRFAHDVQGVKQTK